MRKSLLLRTTAALFVLATVAWAQEPTKIEGWSYRSDNPFLTEEWTDKTGKALSDGDPKPRVIYSGGTITVDVDLGRPAQVASVVAHVSRPNDGYKLKTFHVHARRAGHWEEVASVEGFWGHTEQRAFRLYAKMPAVSTDALRLVFDTASILCIGEVEVFGQPAAAPAATGVRLAPVNDAKPSAREADVDGDGKPEVILENALVRLIFWPAEGGVCKSLLYKPAGCELVAVAGAGYGLFRDQLWSPAYAFADRPYTVRTGGEGNTAWVELATTGVGGMMGFTHISRRISLSGGSPVVRARYRLQNDPSSQTDYTYGLWFHNFLGVPGGENRYFDPTEEGVQEYAFDPQHPRKDPEVWHRNPARGWTAVCGANGAGLAVGMEYRLLNCLYHWSGVGAPVATHEWRLNRMPLKSGQALETSVTLMPFQGLGRVDGVVEDVLGAVGLQPAEGEPAAAEVTLALASPQAKPASGILRLRALPDGAWREVGRLDVVPGKPAAKSISLADLPAGGYVLNCQVQRDGKTLDDFERAFSRGGARVAYHRAPLEKRAGLAAEETAPRPRHDLSDAVATPHVPWGKPLPGGPIKAVVLCDDEMSREVIELKQRLDLDVTYVKFRTTLWKEDLWCGDRSISTPAQANARLLEHLKANRYELVLLAGFHWNAHFTPEVRDAVTRQVREGAGILFIQPDGFKAEDPLAPMMGIARTRSMWEWAKWQPAGESPLAAGLPWDLFPQTRLMAYDRQPEGEVAARLSNGKPLLVTNSLGKGRTAALTYDVLTHDMSYRGYAGLTPILSYRGGFLRPEFKEMTWQYHEAWYAWLARIAAWAAGRDTGVRIVSLEPLKNAIADAEVLNAGAAAKQGNAEKTAGRAEPDAIARKAALPLRLAGGTGKYTVTAEFRNRWSQPITSTKAVYTPGQEVVAIPVPRGLGAGVNPVNVIVRDAACRSVAWGQTYVTSGSVKVAHAGGILKPEPSGEGVPFGPLDYSGPPVAIKRVQPEKEIVLSEPLPRAGQPYHVAYRAKEPFRVTVTLEKPIPSGCRMTARLFDTHRRLLVEQTRPMPVGTTEMRFEARPAELRANGLEWEIAIPGHDVSYARVICPKPREWGQFRLTSWGGVYPWRSEYLYPALGPRVEDLVDVAFHGITEMSTGHVWTNFWYNIDWSNLGLLSYLGKGVPDFMDDKFAEKVAKYQQSKDKQWLVRTPCLSDPEWRGKAVASLRARAGEAMQYGGAIDYCMGDEMSLTYYTAFFDYCWSPHCLAGFRTWLQARYPSLDALNKAWETGFASWDAVLPMTLDEVKTRANAAPWCEFRDYMNDVIAGFYSLVRKTLREVDPQARAGLSGTQEPRAGNGMDWWKNSAAFDYYHAYNTGWSNEMRRSFAPYTGVKQTPYYAGYWQAGRKIEYNMFWCLLHDTEAVSAWATPIFFYHDFTYSESGRDTMALCHEMKRGLWDLIRGARRQHDGIAIHYSHDSINASQLLGKENEIVSVRDAWVKVIEDLGLQYNFVATPQIESGILTRPKNADERYRVLLLPESFAISEKEKTEIEAFVKAGGTVVADMNAGLMDGKCRRGAAGVLDGLFGIRRESGPAGAVGVTVDGLQISDLGLQIGRPAGATQSRSAKAPAPPPPAAGRPAPAAGLGPRPSAGRQSEIRNPKSEIDLKLPVAEALSATTAKALGRPAADAAGAAEQPAAGAAKTAGAAKAAGAGVAKARAAGAAKAAGEGAAKAAGAGVAKAPGAALAPAGGVPGAVFCNAAGKGRAWYLNLSLAQFDNERTFHSATEKGVRALLRGILAGAGVAPAVEVSLASGRAPHMEVVRYRAGDLTYLGLLSGTGEAEEIARVTLPQASYIYDCRTAEALGKRAEVRATFAGGQARVYCLSPAPLPAPRLALAAKTAKPGEAVAYTVSIPGGQDARRQLVRLTVLRPDGGECKEYTRNLLLGAREFSGSFRLALNDPKGTWRLIARDLCTGAKSEAVLEIR